MYVHMHGAELMIMCSIGLAVTVCVFDPPPFPPPTECVQQYSMEYWAPDCTPVPHVLGEIPVEQNTE